MQRLPAGTSGAIDIGGGRIGFRDENPAAGIQGTDLPAAWLNALQEEILAVIEAAQITPSGADLTQLLQAIRATGSFPSGTRMLFQQTAAPPGWTKLTDHDNKALRVVSGTAGSGGTGAFTGIFSARTLTVANLPSHSHGVNDPGHAHTFPRSEGYLFGTANGAGNGDGDPPHTAWTFSATTGISIQSTGSGSPIDFAVAYVDVIIAQKD